MTILKSKLDALIAARAIIADEAHWTRGDFAKDSMGYSADSTSNEAVCWCSIGALEKASDTGSISAMIELNRTVQGSMSEYNDTHSHAEVLAVWDSTIERLRSQDEIIRRVAMEESK